MLITYTNIQASKIKTLLLKIQITVYLFTLNNMTSLNKADELIENRVR